jgi:predicted anti-sigma-YlaC factor YlaD
VTCHEAEELLLESFDEAPAPVVRRALDAHVAGCRACSAFAARLRLVDAELAAALPPPAVPVSLAPGVRARVRRERIAAVTESLPDIIHLAGCGVATVVCAALLPFDAPVTIAAGLGFTCVTYVFMALVRWSIEATGQPDW